jgi:hypothetical protein
MAPTRTCPDDVLCDVYRTHPHVIGADPVNGAIGYRNPATFLGEQAERDLRPPGRAPDVELLDPTVDQLAIIEQIPPNRLTTEDREALRLASGEILRNAYAHGLPPVRVRIWGDLDRITVAVSDRGPGLWDPFAGLVPEPEDRASLWSTTR